MIVDQNFFIPKRPFFANKKIHSRIFRERHIYLLRDPDWPIMPLMKMYLPPVKLHQKITDYFLVAF